MRALLINPKAKGIDKIELREINNPEASKGKVLVKIMAVPLSAWEKEIILNNDEAELTEQISNKTVNLGLEFSGIVASDGEHFHVGDRVLGSVDLFDDEKAMSEYISVNEAYLCAFPESLSFAQGAALPIGAEAAYIALNQLAKTGKEKTVLILGANGGVGVYAVQFAAAQGAVVTTIGSASTMGKLKQLGANVCYDYNNMSPMDLKEKFDVIFDLSKTMKFKDAEKRLNPKGVFINANPQFDLEGMELATQTDKQSPLLMVAHGSNKNLEEIMVFVNAGKIKPIVDKIFNIQDFKQAFLYLVEKGRWGKIIIEF